MSGDTIKGTIQQVSSKEGNKHPKFGRSWRVGLKIEDVWYNAFMKAPAEDSGLEEGVLVTFSYSENGDYMNFDPKSLKVSTKGEAKPASSKTSDSGASQSTGSGSKGSYTAGGVEVGHAINNAVQIAIAQGVTGQDGKTNLKAIHGIAVDILTLSVKLKGQYEKIIAAASKAVAPKTAPAEQQQEEQQEEAPPPPPKAKPKPAAAKKATPPPAEPDQGGFEDDDIPF